MSSVFCETKIWSGLQAGGKWKEESLSLTLTECYLLLYWENDKETVLSIW